MTKKLQSGEGNTLGNSLGSELIGNWTARIQIAVQSMMSEILPVCVLNWLNSPSGGKAMVEKALDQSSKEYREVFREELSSSFGRQEEVLKLRLESHCRKLLEQSAQAVLLQQERHRAWLQLARWALGFLVVFTALFLGIQGVSQLTERMFSVRVQGQREELAQLTAQVQRRERELIQMGVCWTLDPDGSIWVQTPEDPRARTRSELFKRDTHWVEAKAPAR